jgi:2-methylisocitrate lyase-like PEP mutase family enzyme
MNASEKRAALVGAIKEGRFVVAPGVYDMISAKIADRMGFEAIYMTGYGVAASYLGLPDAGIATYADLVSRVRTIAGGTNSPVICDADTGFGGLLNVQHTVRGYEEAGCSAIQLEDQEIPKKCGHTPGRRVVPIEDMVEKIRVATEARTDPNFLIIARTDSRTSLGLDEALKRGRAYGEAGADVIFIEAPESEEEIARVGAAFDKPLLANMVDSGNTPIVSADRLKELGFNIAIYPAIGMLPAAGAMQQAFGSLLKDGSTKNVDVPMISLPEMHELMGFEDVWAFERRWARAEAAE